MATRVTTTLPLCRGVLGGLRNNYLLVTTDARADHNRCSYKKRRGQVTIVAPIECFALRIRVRVRVAVGVVVVIHIGYVQQQAITT